MDADRDVDEEHPRTINISVIQGDPTEGMDSQTGRLTDAYCVGIKLQEHLREGASLGEGLKAIDGPFDQLNDGYPAWHPASYSFHGMLKLFLYREITGESYRSLARSQDRASVFGLNRMPDESVLSRTWRKRFDAAVRAFITTAAHFLVKEIHDTTITVPAVRPKEEVLDADTGGCSSPGEPDASGDMFTGEEIHRTTRLARTYSFEAFESGRAGNATYEDTQFFELQTFMGMVGCGTAQGAARFQFRRGKEYGPHGDTHLRAVKQFEPATLIDGFDNATERLLSVIQSEASFRRPVTVAIDITTVPYYGDVEAMPMVSGTPDRDRRALKFATLSIVGWNIPLVLAVEPVRESSPWDENPPNQIHRVVRRLVRRVKEYVPIERVLCDREFDSMQVFQTLSSLNVNYLIPKRMTSSEREMIETMEADGQEVAVESTSVHVKTGSHPMRFLYVPSVNGTGMTVFATNLRVGSDEAESLY